jgi:integrase/recombinase XerC
VATHFFVQTRTHRTRDKALDPHAVNELVRKKVSPIVGKSVHPHALRHSFAARLMENDAPIDLVQHAMGHAYIRTTTIYTHVSSGKRRRDLEKYMAGTGRA